MYLNPAGALWSRDWLGLPVSEILWPLGLAKYMDALIKNKQLNCRSDSSNSLLETQHPSESHMVRQISLFPDQDLPGCSSPTHPSIPDACPSPSPQHTWVFSELSWLILWSDLKLWLKVLVHQLCLTLCTSVDCSSPGSFVHGILQVRILEWVATPFTWFQRHVLLS